MVKAKKRVKGDTPKATDRVYHKAYKQAERAKNKERGNRRQSAIKRTQQTVKKRTENANIIYGVNPVFEALESRVPAQKLYLLQNATINKNLAKILTFTASLGIPEARVSKFELDEMTGNGVHQGVALAVNSYQYLPLSKALTNADLIEKNTNKKPTFIMLDSITDPQNLGAIVRSAAAFAVSGVIIPKNNAAEVTPAVWKASAGNLAKVPVIKVTNLHSTLETLKEHGYFAVAMDAKADVDIKNTGFAGEKVVLIMGSEGAGVSRLLKKTADIIASINTPSVESLNVSVATGIALFELCG
ncbi:MAG: 23S rRNA (guanosine(2251)-2'-O)-methyltransferase RlmB [Bifidobacteriaceae bacterium]|jgi:23S rRNA (guanosine2251-2'-O)-methyltransferase|nr:23S rRNA (guanosine(2251)-2'-O)-methyltransferase RlmB [Bifidobacteriaceae bacterium]